MWFDAAQVSVTNGNKVVVVNSTESIANINPADALIVSAFSAVEIARAYTTDQGQFIELVKPWPNATQTTVPAYALPTSGDFNAAVKALKDASQIVHDNYQAMLDWQTKSGSVTFKDLDGNTHSVKTLKQRMSELEQIHPFPWAFRKKDIDAIRAQNMDKYEASGFVYFGKHFNSGFVNEGLTAWTSAWATDPENKLWLGRDIDDNNAKSESTSAVISIAGVLTDLESIGDDYNGASRLTTVLLPPAEDGTRTYDSATGIPVRHATPALAFGAETTTNKVVTERVDMWGFELYLRKITDADPFVYANGLIQSHASNINGVTTTNDTIKPIEYFAWFEGDDSSRGRGVNWQTATEAQRIAIASDPKNNIYFDDATGKFYQWCVRGRSFAGAGNGDWSSLDSYGPYACFDVKNRVKVQGYTDSDLAYSASATSSFNSGGNAKNHSSQVHNKGIFSSKYPNFSVNGECYFLVCGTVNRLNKGAYHPSFNPFGSAAAVTAHSDGSVRGNFWHATNRPLTSKAQCFNNQAVNVPNAVAGSYDNTGSLLSSSTFKRGRPDGRYHDAIYASGQGGVCRDMRYSASGLSLEDFAEHDLKVKSGEYRGVEKLTHCQVYDVPSPYSSVDSDSFPSLKLIPQGFENLTGDTLALGENYLVFNNDTNEFFDSDTHQLSTNASATRHLYYPEHWGEAPKLYLIPFKKLNTSISDEYTHTDVIGDPANILLCDDLKDGWIGGYSPDLPDGSNKEFKFTRPVLSFSNWGSTPDNGVNWTILTTTPSSFDAAKNSRTLSKSSGSVYIYNYKTKAKMTKGANNSVIYAGKFGLGDVFCSMDSAEIKGRLLGFSLTGDILKHQAQTSKVGMETVYLLSSNMVPSLSQLYGANVSVGENKHQPISLGSPTNDSPAFKALNYVTGINGQAFICYAYAELIYDSVAGNWGDDGQVHIVDGQSTVPDLNGHTVKVGTAIIVEPLGWVKNAA